MSAPIDDDETSKQQMIPKRFQEQSRISAASSFRTTAPPMSPSRAQGQSEWGETSGLPPSGRGLENEIRRRRYEPEAEPVPQLRRRQYSVLMLISGLAIAAACMAVLMVMIASITKPLWLSSGAQQEATKLSSSLTANQAPAGAATGSGAQHSGGMQGQQDQLAAFARQFNPVQGVTENEIRFGISAPFTGAAKELGQNMKLGIDAAFNAANASGGVHGR